MPADLRVGRTMRSCEPVRMKKPRPLLAHAFVLRMHTILLAALAVFALSTTPGCGSTEDNEFKSAVFEGLQNLAENADGTWTLSWSVAADESPVYLVYSGNSPETINFETPLIGVPETSFTTAVLFFQPVRCFVVRVSTEKLVSDDNKNSKCTEKRDLSFVGLQNIEQDSNGHYILSWTALPLPGIRYAVYSRVAGDDSIAKADIIPLDKTSSNVFDAGAITRGVGKCFWLSLDTTLVPLAVPDSLSKSVTDEKCTDQEALLDFAGIQTLEYGTEDLTMVLGWTESPSAEVTSYRIYEGPQQGTLQVVIEAKDARYYDPASKKYRYTVSTSSENRIYHWSVRASDAVNRDDGNTQTMALRANIEYAKPTP
jgi:hypothetical protein